MSFSVLMKKVKKKRLKERTQNLSKNNNHLSWHCIKKNMLTDENSTILLLLFCLWEKSAIFICNCVRENVLLTFYTHFPHRRISVEYN